MHDRVAVPRLRLLQALELDVAFSTLWSGKLGHRLSMTRATSATCCGHANQRGHQHRSALLRGIVLLIFGHFGTKKAVRWLPVPLFPGYRRSERSLPAAAGCAVYRLLPRRAGSGTPGRARWCRRARGPKGRHGPHVRSEFGDDAVAERRGNPRRSSHPERRRARPSTPDDAGQRPYDAALAPRARFAFALCRRRLPWDRSPLQEDGP
jgi:hypothetical protein